MEVCSVLHGVSIEYPALPGTLYMRVASSGWGEGLYDFVCWDPINKKTIPLLKEVVRFEELYKSGLQIENQKELYHSYCEGSMNALLATDLIQSIGAPADLNIIDKRGAYIKCAARPITLVNGKSLRIPSSRVSVETRNNKSYDKVLTSSGMIASITYSKGGVLLDSMSFSAVFLGQFDPNTSQVCSITRQGHQNGPTFYSNAVNHDYKETSTHGSICIEIGSVSPANFSSIKNKLSEIRMGKIPSHLIPSDLTDRIYSQLVIPDVNNIENLAGLKEIRETIPHIRALIAKHNITSLAELYLMWKYEFSTTAMDIKAYWQYIQRLQQTSRSQRQMVHLSAFEGNKKTCFTISFSSYSSSIFESLGINLTSSNVWDTLPFSFVVDWFIGIGDTLQRLHEENVLTGIPVNYCTTSSTVTEYVTIQNGPFQGCGYKRVMYNRTVTHNFPTPDVDVVFKNPVRHVFDGSALYVANRRH